MNINLNLIRTIIGGVVFVLVGAIGFLPNALGCTVDTTGSIFDCSHSWMPVGWAAAIAAILGGIALVVKFAEGAGLKPVAPVDWSGTPGTVTPAQVASNSGSTVTK